MQSTQSDRLISVIIPIYNTSDYIEECISSLLCQTYKSFEILLIDDGSTDNSAELCEKIAATDERIRFFKNENHGVSFSRNFGIKQSRGEYIAFVDSDDIVSDDYLSVLLSTLEDNSADMATVDYCCFTTGEPLFTYGSTTVYKENLSTLFFTVTEGIACAKLIKRALLEDGRVCFNEELAVNEDLVFALECAKRASVIAVNNSRLYGYRRRAASAVQNTASLKWFDCLKAYKMLFTYCEQTEEIRPFVTYNYLKKLYEARYAAKKYSFSAKDIGTDVNAEIKKTERHNKPLLRRLSKKQRFNLFVCKHFFALVQKRRKL